MSGLLFGVTGDRSVAFSAMLVVLTLVSMIAGYLPARRASRLGSDAWRYGPIEAHPN
jgi:hypothetical protein